ncbi:DUF6274 family protein [Streptomyces sp. NPDC008150]|uniref:DUF6274 family protein n=1 Tax=Streptomyces sp. NPDC008150 TaxID=3364816 RepID=UPI0036E7137B
MAEPTRHETRALLRAHLAAAASSYGHRTRHCPVCHHLLRMVTDAPPRAAEGPREDEGHAGHEEFDERPEPSHGGRTAVRPADGTARPGKDESPSPA